MTLQQKIILAAVIAALAGFAVGALWQYTNARSQAQQRAGVERDLAFQTLEATLGAATIEAQRGSYEISRQLTSEFFSGLQRELGRAPAERRAAFEEILQQRDAMITALSRSDPQAGAMLAQLFTRYRIAMGETVGPNAGAAPAPAAAPTAPPAPSAPEPDNR
jgi:hypothetical protein